jgi:hypothetical protein
MNEERSSTKAGWNTDDWCHDTGVGRTTSYTLEWRGKIKVVRAGTRRIIVTTPAEYLASLAAEQAERAGLAVRGAS